MAGYDYQQYDVCDCHDAAPVATPDGFRLQVGRESAGRSGRAVSVGSFGAVILMGVLAMLSDGVPLNLRAFLVVSGVVLVGLALLMLAARVFFIQTEVVCEEDGLFSRRSWLGGMTDVWSIQDIRGFVAHPRAVRFTESRRAYSSEHMACTVSARGDGEKLDLLLSLRQEQAERVAADLTEALAELRVRQASRRGFRG